MKEPNADLVQFIAKARAAGKSPAQIRDLLVQAGWSPEQVAPYVTSAGELVAPPPPPPQTSARDIFFYLLAFFTLGTTAVSLGAIIFAIIDHYLSDAVVMGYADYTASRLQGPLASFIVATPIFMAVSWKLYRDITRGLSSLRSKIRKVLTYLALFLASATVIGDIIGLVYRFLSGEVNARFSLKVLTILLIGGWVIWYYWTNMRRDDKVGAELKTHDSWQRAHAATLVLIGVACVVWGFMIMGSPAEQQRQVRDQRRISDLQSIYYGMQSYYQRQQKLPDVLEEIASGYVSTLPIDPQTQQPYAYVKGEGSQYQLCASFETDDAKGADLSLPRPVAPELVNWTHPASQYCFELDAKPPKN